LPKPSWVEPRRSPTNEAHHGGLAPRRFVVMVWTPRDNARRIVSMRYGHADEEAYYREQKG
jgi:uncharacterized DUF497 family protein